MPCLSSEAELSLQGVSEELERSCLLGFIWHDSLNLAFLSRATSLVLLPIALRNMCLTNHMNKSRAVLVSFGRCDKML